MGGVDEQDQLRDLITEIRGEENSTGCVEYDRFEKVVVRIFTDDAAAFKRDTDEKILRAFRAFDPEVSRVVLMRPADAVAHPPAESELPQVSRAAAAAVKCDSR
jgi:hypothetical protein